MREFASVPVVKTTSLFPAPAGRVQVIFVLVPTGFAQVFRPTFTVGGPPRKKFLPKIVKVEPPDLGPRLGNTLKIFGPIYEKVSNGL
jgi:hypothetical protein